MSQRSFSRRAILKGAGGALGASAVMPVFLSIDARAADKIQLTLPWIPEGEVAFMYAAQREGFWSKRNLDVEISRGFGSGEAAKNVGLGRYEFGQADIGAMIKASGAGLPQISVAMVNQSSPICILSLQASGITKPKDLEGKRLGGAAAGAAMNLWPVFAAVNGVDAAKVRLISLQPGLNIQALVNRDVDAVAVLYQSSAPYLWADNVAFNSIFFSAHGLDLYSLTFITQLERIKSAKKQVADFVAGAMEGLKFSYLEPDKTLAHFITAVPEAGKTERDRAITRHSLLINSAAGLVEDARQNGLGWHSPQKLEHTLKTANTYLKMPSLPAIDTVYSNEFVGTVKLTDAEWARARETAKNHLVG